MEKEQEVIAKLKKSCIILENMFSPQILEEDCKNSWRKNRKLLGETDQLTDSDHPLTNVPSTDGSYPLKSQVAVDEEKLKSLTRNLVPSIKNLLVNLANLRKLRKEE